jgi:peptidoglycan/LPS O-acetylase OafA/YrhL
MTVGALGAWLVIVSPKFKKQIEELSRFKIASIYIIFLLLYLYKYQLFVNEDGRIFEKLVIACVIILIILEQNYSKNSFFKMSQFKTISKLGIITYGLYCLHFIGILITTTLTKKLGINTELWQVFFVDTTISFILALVLGKISYRFIEAPILKFKDRFSSFA